MYTCMHTYGRIRRRLHRAYVHPHRRTRVYVPTYARVCMCLYIYIYICTHTHVDVHPCTYVQVPACIQSAYTQVDVHRCAHMYTRTQTRVCIHTWTYASVYVCIYSHVSAWMSTCARVCLSIGVYTYIYILTDTHVHTRTETHIRVCVCVCLSVCLSVVCAHTPVYTGKAQAYCKRGFSVQHRSRRQTPQPPKGKQPPMSEVGRRPEQTPSFQRKVEQTDTQKHKGEHTSTAGLGWAGLGWAGAAGGGGGLTEAPHPGAFPWTMILLIRRGKAREPGIALTTASSNPQRTVAPDGSNASFLQLRKLWADSERSDLIPWRLTDRETTSLGKRVLRCTLPQRFPHSTQPSNSTGCPRREGTKKIRTCVCEGSTPIPR